MQLVTYVCSIQDAITTPSNVMQNNAQDDLRDIFGYTEDVFDDDDIDDVFSTCSTVSSVGEISLITDEEDTSLQNKEDHTVLPNEQGDGDPLNELGEDDPLNEQGEGDPLNEQQDDSDLHNVENSGVAGSQICPREGTQMCLSPTPLEAYVLDLFWLLTILT